MSFDPGQHFADWCRSYLIHPQGIVAGQPKVLEQWQLEFYTELLRINPDTGRRYWRFCLNGRPRKQAKSEDTGAMALYMTGWDGEVNASTILVAKDKEQAREVFVPAVRFIQKSPLLKRVFKPTRYEITHIDGGKITRAATDGGGLHGSGPSFVSIDELHAWRYENSQIERDPENNYREAFQAILSGGGGRFDPLALVITTAGFDRSSILGELYDEFLETAEIERRPGLIIARDYKRRRLMWWHGVPEDTDPDDMETIKLANPASWRTIERLQEDRDVPGVSDAGFLRLHGNTWTTREAESWIGKHVWEKSEDRSLPRLPPPGVDVWLGIDASLSDDCTAVGWSYRVGTDRPVIGARIWTARENIPGHVYHPGRIRMAEVEQFIRELCERCRVQAVLYDPRFAHRSAELLADEGVPVVEMSQSSAPMAKAWQSIYTAIQDAKLQHDADDLVAEHVTAAQGDMSDRGWVVSKRKNHLKFDALVAMTLADFGREEEMCGLPEEPVEPFILTDY